MGSLTFCLLKHRATHRGDLNAAAKALEAQGTDAQAAAEQVILAEITKIEAEIQRVQAAVVSAFVGAHPSDIRPVDTARAPAETETTQEIQNADTGQRAGAEGTRAQGAGGEGASVLPEAQDGGATGRRTGRAGGPDGADLRNDRGTGDERGREPAIPGEGGQPEQRTEPGRGGRNRAGDRVSQRGTDYRVAGDIEAVERTGSWKDTAKRNLDIIELSKKIEAEGRPATPEEQALLAQYTGWGAMDMRQNVFPTGYSYQQKDSGKLFFPENARDDGWRALAERAEELLTKEEQKEALSSTQYAHYTSPTIIRGIYDVLQKMGFKEGKVLEPGMGSGLFAMLMPNHMHAASRYTGIEKDILTGRIAKLLLPEQNVITGDFTRTKLPRDYFDAAIGNPPFASIRITDDPAYKKQRFFLHDYFFAKSIDSVRPGGLLVFVTSNGTMDKKDSTARDYLAARADLLGAIRLPQTAFKKNAGTEVVTDILFLRKREPGEAPAGQAWTGLAEVPIEGKDPALVNEYYVQHPDMVLGRHSREGKMYQADSYTVLPLDGNIEEHFSKAAEKLPADVYAGRRAVERTEEAVERDFNPKVKKEGGLYLNEDGRLMKVSAGSGVHLAKLAGRTKPLSERERTFLVDYVGLRDAVKDAQLAQWNDADWEGGLKKLQAAHRAFVKKHGHIRDFSDAHREVVDEDGEKSVITTRRWKNSVLIRKADVEFGLVWALESVTEDGKIVDGDFLKGRTIAKPAPVEIKTIGDALATSLDSLGGLDLADVGKRLNMDVPATIESLGDLIYEEPGGTWQLADEYLSGNVVEKLEQAEVAARDDPDRFKRNVEALAKVQPEPLGADKITVRLGANWIAPEYIEKFAEEVLEQGTSVAYEPAINLWKVSGSSRSYRSRAAGAASEYGTADRSPLEILDAVLNNRSLTIRRTDSDGKSWTDQEATTKVNDIAQKMRQGFASWIWTDAERTGALLDVYNRKFNNLAPRKFDGSHLSMPGVSLQVSLLPHQKRGIWRAIQTGNMYAAHAVGAGKTYMSIGATMEQKRLGLIKKPMFAVPNHMLEQFASEFKQMYPTANIMVADDENFTGDERRQFVAQAAVNAPDAIIITHSAFGLVPLSDKARQDYIGRVIGELQAALAETPKNDRMTRRQLEQRIETLERRMAGRAGRADKAITFEDMGVDYLVVDEAHEFRKLDFFTNRTGKQAKGISPEGSARTMDLHMKVMHLEAQRPGRTHMFLSGTPITNTMGELYTLMRFFEQEGMEADGIDHFDAWATSFGSTVPGFERNAAGQYEVVERFSRFDNVPELMARVRRWMDVLTSEQLGVLVKRPNLEGGRVQNMVVKPSAALKRYMEGELRARIEASRKWKPTQNEPNNPDPLINIITDGRLATLDDRFFNAAAPNNPESKLNKMVDEVIRLHKEYANLQYTTKVHDRLITDPIKGGTQIVFSPIGFGEGVAARRGFDAKEWVTKRLLAGGFKRSEIAWMSDIKGDAQKAAMFADMRAGKVKVLIGSPKNMGTGVNVQKRLKALHYLAPPWFPADVEQPHGRILRQGNQNDEVRLAWYATEGTYDSTQWSMVTRKAKFIEAAMTGDKSVRSVEDISEVSSYEMASALSAGDDRVIRLAGLSADVERLTRLRAAHFTQQSDIRWRIKTLDSDVKYAKKRITEIKKPLEGYEQMWGSDFRAEVDGKAFSKREDFGDALKAALNRTYVEAIANKLSDKTYLPPIGKIGKYPLVPLVAWAGKDKALLELHVQFDGRTVDYGVFNMEQPIAADANPQGIATKVVNAHNELPRMLDGHEARLSEAQNDLAMFQKRQGVPFAEEKELNDKIAEKAALEKELADEGKAKPQSDLPSVNEDTELPDAPIDALNAPALPTEDDTQTTQARGARVKLSDWTDGDGMAGYALHIADDANSATIARDGLKAAPDGYVYLWENGLDAETDKVMREARQSRNPELSWDEAGAVPEAYYAVDLAELTDRIEPDPMTGGIRVKGDIPAAALTRLEAPTAPAPHSTGTYSVALLEAERITAAAAGDEVEQRIGQFAHQPPVRILDSAGGVLPWTTVNDRVAGAVHEGSIYLFLDQLGSRRDVQRTLFHELFHYGVRRFLKKDEYIEHMTRLADRDASIKAEAKRWAATAEGRRAAEFDGEQYALARGVDEALAQLAEPNGGVYLKQGVLDRVLRTVTTWLAEVAEAFGFKETAAEIRSWHSKEAREFIQTIFAKLREDAEPASDEWGFTADPAFSTITAGALADAWHPIAQRAHDAVFNAIADGRTFGWWSRTIGTQMHKARNNAEFGRVFNRSQKFIDDIARYSLKAEGLAPTILPKVGGLKDVPNAVMNALGKRGMSVEDNKLLGKMLSEGTLAGDDASPLKGQVWSEADLRGKFGATPVQIRMYHEARAAIDQSLADTGRATMLSTMRAAGVPQGMIDVFERTASHMGQLRHLLGAQIDALIAKEKAAADERFAARKAELEAEMEAEVEQYPYPSDKIRVKSEYWDRIARAKKTAYAKVTALDELDSKIGAIEKKVNDLQEHGYAPLMRFGRFYLTAREGEEVSYFSRYESIAELLRDRRRLMNEHPEWQFENGELSMQGHELFEGVDPHTLMLFAQAAGFEDAALQKWYELAVADRSALKRLIHRKGTEGYSLDSRRTLASFLTSNARFASNALNAPVMKDLAQEIGDGGVKDEAVKLVNFVLKPGEEAAAVRGLMFTWYLGGSLASGFVNLTQPVMMTFPYLARFGVKQAASAMAAGMQAATRAMREVDVGDRELARAMRQAKEEGITEPSEIYALMAASRGAYQTPLLQAFHTTWGANFALTEAFNRTTTFAAAFIAARAAGDANPYAFAKKAIYDTQGLYTRANRPNWARSAVGATLFTFKQYSIAYLEFLKQLASDGTIPKTQVGIALGLLVLGAGLQGLPGAEDLDDILDALGQWLGFATNTRRWKREALESVMGETMAQVAMYGLSTQLGLDLSARLGMGNLIPGTGALVPSNRNKGRDVAEWAGPLGGLVSSGVDGLERLFRGDWGGAAQKMVPRAAGAAMAGGTMLVTGEARDAIGRKVTDVNPAEALGKMVGFNPQRVATQGRAIRELRQDADILNERRQYISELWSSGVASGDKVAVQRAQEALREWNADNPDMRIQIRPQDIMRRAKAMRESRDQRFMKSVPKTMRDRARAILEKDDGESDDDS